MTYEQELEPIRDSIDRLDQTLLKLLTMRSNEVGKVGALKKKYGKSLQASDREAQMFKKLSDRCEELGLDKGYAFELWSLIIWNSKLRECKEADRTTFMNQEPVPPEELRRNLLALTKAVSPWYDEYCNGVETHVIRAYRDREEHTFNRALEQLGTDGRGLALDLGCASGQVTRYLEDQFQSVRAFDVSPDMIAEAYKRREWKSHVTFEKVDLELGIPAEDSSASFAIANFGAASELGPNLLTELSRVLRPGGKAILSFYNRDALVNQWFYPWPATVHTRGNPWNETVEVWTRGSVYVVQGKSETISDLETSCKAKRFTPDFWETHPTFGGMLPAVFFEQSMYSGYIKSVSQIDNHLARSNSGVNQGTYILTVLTKN